MMLYYTNSDNITLPEVILVSMKSSFRSLLDRFAAAGSLVCALHCAITPLLLAVIPSLGLSIWLGDGFERGFVVFVTVLGLFSLVWGYRRHRAFRALGMLLFGLMALWAGVLYAPLHEAAVPHAVVMTVGGCWWGWRTC